MGHRLPLHCMSCTILKTRPKDHQRVGGEQEETEVDGWWRINDTDSRRILCYGNPLDFESSSNVNVAGEQRCGGGDKNLLGYDKIED